MFSILLATYVEATSLGHMGTPRLAFRETDPVFYSSGTISYAHQQRRRLLVFPQPHQHLLLSVLLVLAILVGMPRHLAVVWAGF